MKTRVVISDFGYPEAKRISLPRPLWEGCEKIDNGIDLLAIYQRRDGRIIIKTDSIWEDRDTHCCLGIKYELVDENYIPEHIWEKVLEIMGAVTQSAAS